MAKTITLRLPDDRYRIFKEYADRDDRPISNLLEMAAWRHLQECSWMDPAEENEILADKKLVASIRRGIRDSKKMKGRFVD